MKKEFKTIFELQRERGIAKGIAIAIAEARIEKAITEGIAIGEAKFQQPIRKGVAAIIRYTKLTDTEIATELDIEESFVQEIRATVVPLMKTKKIHKKPKTK